MKSQLFLCGLGKRFFFQGNSWVLFGLGKAGMNLVVLFVDDWGLTGLDEKDWSLIVKYGILKGKY